MGLADIQEKQSEERKREKRLVHFTNSVTRGFLGSKYVKSRTKAVMELVEYITKSFLDHLFFDEHKEIRELQGAQVDHFMMDFAPRKLDLDADRAKAAAPVLADFFAFLEDEGHIHNGREIGAVAQKNATAFSKLFPKVVKKAAKRATRKGAPRSTGGKTGKEKFKEMNIGRNDPCPCGSGKKYKKCCGKNL